MKKTVDSIVRLCLAAAVSANIMACGEKKQGEPEKPAEKPAQEIKVDTGASNFFIVKRLYNQYREQYGGEPDIMESYLDGKKLFVVGINAGRHIYDSSGKKLFDCIAGNEDPRCSKIEQLTPVFIPESTSSEYAPADFYGIKK
ncbi:hypothetical protein KY345_04365 [Candidatus Woesearchaeota archaeon]|nr:hypothetical protein [Candidatus Woesearchaeota archaeon]